MNYPFLILHGWGAGMKNWNKVKNLLEIQGYEVFAPDLPGFGENPLPEKAWFLKDYAQWVKEFCEKNNLSQVFLLGHSFGGRIAIKFALQYPEKLPALILVSSGGAETSEKLKNLEKRLFKSFASFMKIFYFLPKYQFFRKCFYRFVIRKTDYLEAQGTLKETFKNTVEENLIPCLEKIKIPTLIVWGKKDKVLSFRQGFLMKEKIFNSKIEILENIGHNLHRESPEALTEKVLSFIKKL